MKTVHLNESYDLRGYGTSFAEDAGVMDDDAFFTFTVWESPSSRYLTMGFRTVLNPVSVPTRYIPVPSVTEP